MTNFNSVLNTAIQRCDNITIYDKAFDVGFEKIYPFTTENISGYIDKFKLEDKSLLTVGSSGDQVINACFKGSKDITILDINPYTKFYYYLKVASILELNYDDFFKFICPTNYTKFYRINQDLFNQDTFNKIKATLRLIDYESYLFWDELFSNYNFKNIYDCLFKNDIYETKTIKKINPYLSSEINYNEVKRILTKINVDFIIDNILNVKLDKKFDNIWLSNIGRYLNLEEIITLIRNMFEYLNTKGELFDYYYKTNEQDSINNMEQINSKTKLDNYLNYFHLFDTSINNSYSNSKKDAVIVYKKLL